MNDLTTTVTENVTFLKMYNKFNSKKYACYDLITHDLSSKYLSSKVWFRFVNHDQKYEDYKEFPALIRTNKLWWLDYIFYGIGIKRMLFHKREYFNGIIVNGADFRLLYKKLENGYKRIDNYPINTRYYVNPTITDKELMSSKVSKDFSNIISRKNIYNICT